ncbi:MAG: biopolymer transporter ExbD [Bacteroidia bacterium]|nr:biopolymer transporter ExbD [Bacteroidia bacterium]NNF30777.1 biopolymer transporter ExbD [Flavobacteriaceae bacterium]MBT8277178.1 biopolymer transporter ExbD [Bacteroidia bacterium]NNJ82709.1 biopolymer transporter ExbD [Flavobacteriaceae bacterium]NNK54755.1 biopolymer transporter ExbD [Flavobacteriaceae bacterium]
MSKFKKKKGGELPHISTASLPDIVFMLLFFFMVVTVLRDTNLLVQNQLPKADQVEKLKKDRAVYIYAGKPSSRYQEVFGTEGRIQIGDKYTSIENIGLALEEARRKLLPELQDKVYVALKVDGETNTGLVSDIKQVLRERNLLKIIYITTPGTELSN